jgi:DNA-binding MarR family transcriptional regulator/GNAT superfamily N-acetyltransferase
MATALERRVDGVRRFNRFYTQRLGVLTDNFLRSPFTLTETRVLWELAHRDAWSPGELAAALGLDPAFLSRVVRRFEEQRLIARATAADDRRRVVLTLTAAGREAFAPLNERQRDEVAGWLEPLPAARQERVLEAMGTIAGALAPRTEGAIVLRDPEPGDLGWVVERHGALYANEYGLDVHMEGYVADVIGRYVANFDPRRDRCWIAERDGVRYGCIFVVHDDDNPHTARLRLLLTEPFARGHGLGRRLVQACVAFARDAGYRKMILWTHSVLTVARAIYASEGFAMTASETNEMWGTPLTSETWELDLSP